MNVKQLKSILEGVSDDTMVVVPGYDHSYTSADVNHTTALREHPNRWTEDDGEDVTPEREYGKRVNVIVIS